MRALLFDGTNNFIINYTANPTLDENGRPAGGISGTLRSLKATIRKVKPDIVFYIWDGPGGSVTRRKLFNEYKKGRRPKTIVGRNYQFETIEKAIENKRWQTETLQRILNSLPICQIVTENIEADDAIAYIAKHHEYFNLRSCIISTCDQDFYQIINDKIVIYNPINKKLITTKSLMDDFGYHPSNWIFYKSINGDKSDNIDGIKGIGPKIISKIFDTKNDRLTIDSIVEKYENISEIENKSIQKKVKLLYENLDLIKRNWKLMCLKDSLMSVHSKDRLTSIVENYKPSLNKISFLKEMTVLGGLNIFPASYFLEFKNLIKTGE